MAVRVNKLLQELNINMSALSDTLKVLDCYDSDLLPNTQISDEVANIIRRLSHYRDVNLLDLVEHSISRRKDQKQYGQVFPWEAGRLDCDTSFNSRNSINTGVVPSQNNENNHLFWIEEIMVQLANSEVSRIKVADFSDAETSPLFSVLIGYNGVGKSSLLREIIDFFIDLSQQTQDSKSKSRNSHKNLFSIVGVRYHADGKNYDVVRLDKTYLATVDGCIRTLDHLCLPAIVASSYATFNKFPVQAVNGLKLSRYDTPRYKYVGAHASGSIISSSAIAFRLLFSLNESMNENQRNNVCSALDFIGYDHKITLLYSFKSISKKQRSAIKDSINLGVQKDKEYSMYSTAQKTDIVNQLYNFFNRKTSSDENKHSYCINIDSYLGKPKDELHYIYKLKKYDLVNSVSVSFHKSGNEISTEEMSSGEFTMLSMVLSISASVTNTHNLILVDEPEISQHPNWQMAIIDNLDKALKNTPCQLLIATHSHMLVSDLPMNRSSVTQLEKDANGTLRATRVFEETYGWSAEEVLLKVFKTATDRNRYFGERIGMLLERMAKNDISKEDVTDELQQLQEISLHLSDVDPMKMVLNTIIETYKA